MRITLTAFAFFFGILAYAADPSPCGSAEEAYVVDADGNLVEAANDIAYEAFAYDDAGRLSEAVTEVGGVAFANAWLRDAGGLVTNVVYADGKSVSRTYDLAGRLVSVTDWLGHEWTFTWDAALPVAETFLYDGNGAMTNATSGGETVFSAAYDAQGRLASLEGSAGFSYDALGNRVCVGGHIFIPDHSDPLKRPLIECDADGAPLRYYIWGPGRLLGFIGADSTLTVAHSDEQGSVIALTDETGELLFRTSYSPHGEDWGFSGDNPTPFAWLGGLGVMRQPNSQLPTPNSQLTTLYLTRHRLYSPVLRRFLSADPFGIDGGLNLYAYANGDPLAYVDPLGLCASDGDVGTRIGGFFQMIGGGAEAALGYGFAGLTAVTVSGAVAGVAVGLHGTDAAIAGYYTMVNGVPQDTLTSQGLQAVGVPQDWANGLDAGISMVGSAGIGIAARASVLGGKTTAVSAYFPANDGVVGEKGTIYLYKGTVIDRYGGRSNSRYFSPVGTPAEMRALPQSSLGGDLRTFRVEKPFPVEQGVVAPAFGQIGLGVQYKAPVNLDVLIDRGILREIR